ncbi:MAG: DUF1566 domain-containing protein, partial [Deltaproteobacteria bacterium]|nr:DUF1566 domain-containing protein [Deltaproteobacteria bacterium]
MDYGTILDNVTGLVWQQQDDNRIRTWSEAGTYCSNLSQGGQTDWRLPGIKELHSIANLSAGLSAAIDLSVFSIADIHQPEYWSSTTRVEYPSHAWYVSFGNGGMYIKDKNDKFYVRCIRGGS